MTRSKKKMQQLELPSRTWGGRRANAGRPKKPKGEAGVTHRLRADFPKRFPLHVTWKILKDVGNLRTDKRFRKIQRAFRYGGDRFGLRLAEFSIQSNHVHLIVEADEKRALSRGLQGLAIRMARGINRAANRRGKVLADRFHARLLRTPAEVKHAVHYVRRNLHHHAGDRSAYVDPFSSMSGEATWHVDTDGTAQLITARVRSWLLARAG